MIRRRLILGLVLLVNLLVSFEMLARVVQPLFDLPPAVLIAAIAAGQGSLLAIGVVLVGRHTPWKLLGGLGLLVLGAHLLEAAFPLDSASWEVFGMPLLTQMLFSAAVLLPARLVGFRVEWPPKREGPSQEAWFQFSLQAMLGWTAVVAVVPGLLQILPRGFRIELFTWGSDPWAILCFGCDAVLTLALVWIALNSRWWKVILAFTALAAAAWLAYGRGMESLSRWMTGVGNQVLWVVVLGILLHTLYVFFTLALLRLAGYRVEWPFAPRK
jgi:hypothetical protein